MSIAQEQRFLRETVTTAMPIRRFAALGIVVLLGIFCMFNSMDRQVFLAQPEHHRRRRASGAGRALRVLAGLSNFELLQRRQQIFGRLQLWRRKAFREPIINERQYSSRLVGPTLSHVQV